MRRPLYPSTPFVAKVGFAFESEGLVHAFVKAVGAPWASTATLCRLPLQGLQKAASWEVMAEKTPGVPANPFYSSRGCEVCQERLAI